MSLSADALTIEAGGKQFVTVPPVEVHGDPGNPNEYTTLELTWQEHGVEMRLFVYFNTDGCEWWSNEIRTYDGNIDGEWITYTGDFFRRPLGTPFVGDFTVAASDPPGGRLHLSNLRLEAFRRSPACLGATGPLALDPGTSPIEIKHVAGGSANFSFGYSARVRLLDTASCLPVANEDRYLYEWQTKDPRVVKVRRPAAEPVASERNGAASNRSGRAARLSTSPPATRRPGRSSPRPRSRSSSPMSSPCPQAATAFVVSERRRRRGTGAAATVPPVTPPSTGR